MKYLTHFITTIIIHITVLSRDPIELRESHCDKCSGNMKQRRLLDHQSYKLNTGKKE